MTVLAELPRKSPCPIAFVAEAPADEEVAGGRPVIGPSGRVFNGMLRTAGIDRGDNDHYIGNVFDVQLPGNSIASWCEPMEVARDWPEWPGVLPPIGRSGVLKPQYLHHLDRLRTELEAANPRVIVPMGGTALWAFTGSDAIGQCRGAVAEATYIMPGCKILPTYHPAFVIKMWKFFQVGVGDILKALRESEFPEVRVPKRRFLLDPKLGEIQSYWEGTLMGAPMISVDIETMFGQIDCIGFSPHPGEALVVPFVDFRKPNRSYWLTAGEEYEALMLVKTIMESDVPKLGQNFSAYDAFWLWDRYGIKTINLQHDTRLLHHAIYPELPKDLGFMGACYTDQGPWKTMRVGKKPDKRDE